MDSTRIGHRIDFQCVVCGEVFKVSAERRPLYVCESCGPVGTLDVRLHHDTPPQRYTGYPLSMWTQRDLLPLPINDEVLPGLRNIGGTPLVGYEALAHVAAALDVAGVCIKNDGLNPTASLKDRASAMVVQHALTGLDRQVIATASTGNAAAALAGCCAMVPAAECVIFVPKTAPEGKIAQMLVFGATVLLVDGDYDTAFDLCWEACQRFDWYNRSTGINPYTSQGKKTVAHEMAFQLGWQMPDVIMVSVGDGSIISGVHIGCKELFALGWVDKMPRIIGVQAAGSDTLAYAWENDYAAEEIRERSANTIADSISSRLPRDRAKALRAVRESNGLYMRVSDDDILHAIPEFARQTGVFAEPAAVAVYPALRQARQQGIVGKNERVVLLITGYGLKDARAALRSVENASNVFNITPQLSAVAQIFEQRSSKD